jgi:hypothetical protein
LKDPISGYPILKAVMCEVVAIEEKRRDKIIEDSGLRQHDALPVEREGSERESDSVPTGAEVRVK